MSLTAKRGAACQNDDKQKKKKKKSPHINITAFSAHITLLLGFSENSSYAPPENNVNHGRHQVGDRCVRARGASFPNSQKWGVYIISLILSPSFGGSEP